MNAKNTGTSSGAWVVALSCLGLWWLAQPYGGILHDATLYAGDAMRRLHPQAFASDIFFHRGSQGDFSVFGAVYAALIGAIGLEPAAFATALLGRCLWLAGLFWLVRTLAPAAAPWVWLWAAALCLPSDYGPLEILNHAEPFATPRIFAEAASLLAVTLALRSRWGLACAVWVLATALHPLMGMFAGGLIVALLPGRRVAWAWALALAALAAMVVWAYHTGVLQRLALRYDDEWFAVVAGRNALILWHAWAPEQLSRALLALLLLGDAWRRLPAGDLLRRAAGTLLAMTLACLLLWFWASESRNILLLQVQPWRVLWLTLLLGPLFWLTAVLRAQGLSGWPLALLVLAWILPFWPTAVIGAVALGLQAYPQAWATPKRQWLLRSLVLGLGAFAVLGVADRMHLAHATLADAPHVALTRLAAWLAEPLVAMVLTGLMGLWMRRGHAPRGAVPAAAAMLMLAVTAWSSWFRMPPPDEEDRRLAVLARAHIPEGACVWSELKLAHTWLELQRCAYVSSYQGAGAQFDRRLALALRARLDRLNELGVTADTWRQDASAPAPAPAPAPAQAPNTAMARAACQDPALDWLLFRGAVAGAHVVIQEPGRPARGSLFDCRRLRPHHHA